jgi:hypothetical protein
MPALDGTAAARTDRPALTNRAPMRILHFSDVHLEVRARQAPSSWTGAPLGFGPDLSAFVGRADLLVLAGDIGRLRSTRNVSPLSYAQQAAAFLGCRVILVPGNHEYYRGSFDGDHAALLAAEIPGVTVLDRGEARIGALRVLGATLWTDYAVTGDPGDGGGRGRNLRSPADPPTLRWCRLFAGRRASRAPTVAFLARRQAR